MWGGGTQPGGAAGTGIKVVLSRSKHKGLVSTLEENPLPRKGTKSGRRMVGVPPRETRAPGGSDPGPSVSWPLFCLAASPRSALTQHLPCSRSVFRSLSGAQSPWLPDLASREPLPEHKREWGRHIPPLPRPATWARPRGGMAGRKETLFRGRVSWRTSP